MAAVPPRTFWVIATGAVIWNAVGLIAFYLDITTSSLVLDAGYTPEQYAALGPVPAWTMVAYAIATLCGMSGSVSLAFRQHGATWLLLASFVAVITQQIHTFLLSESLAIFGLQLLAIQGSIAVVSAALAWYSYHANRSGWLV
jgi:hypothetical protein